MFRYLTTVSFAILTFTLFLCNNAFSGPEEDAEQLFKAGKYAEAEKKLTPILSQANAPANAVSLGIDVALANGEPIKAGQRAKTLYKLSVKGNPALVLKSADTAELLGDRKMAAMRYLSYATKANEKDANFRKAARYVFTNGTYPELLKKYLTSFSDEGAAESYNDDLINQQIDRVLNELWSTNSISDAIDYTDFCLNYYRKSPDHSAHLLRKIRDNVKFIVKPEDRLKVVKMIPKYSYSDPNAMSNVYRDLGVLNKDVGVENFLEALKRNNRPNGELVWGNGSFPDLNGIKDPALAEAFAKYYLSTENFYKDEAWQYARFLDRLGHVNNFMRSKGKELVNIAQYQLKIDELASKFKDDFGAGADNLKGPLGHGLGFFKDDKARGKFLENYKNMLSTNTHGGDRMGEYLRYNASAQTIDGIIERLRPVDPVGAKYQYLGYYIHFKKYDAIPKIVQDYAFANPRYWDTTNAWNDCFNKGDKEIPEAAKMQLLQAIFKNEGKSQPLSKLVGEMKKNGWEKKPAFKTFLSEYKKAQPIIKNQAYELAQQIFRDQKLKDIEPKVAEFLKIYKSKIPGDWKYAKTPMEVLALRVFEHHRNRANDTRNRGKIIVMCETWLPRITEPGLILFSIMDTAKNYDRTKLWKYTQAYADMLQKTKQPYSGSAWMIREAQIPQGDGKIPLFSDQYTNMGTYNALAYIGSRSRVWDKATVDREFTKAFKELKFDFDSSSDFRNNIYNPLQHAQLTLALDQTKFLTGKLLDLSTKDSRCDLEVEGKLFSFLARSGNQKDIDDYVKWYMGKIANRSVTQQMNSLNEAIFGNYQGFSPEFYQTVLIPKLNDLISKLPAGGANINPYLVIHLNWLATSPDSKASPEFKKVADTLATKLLGVLLTNTSRDFRPDGRIVNVCRDQLIKEIAAGKDWKNIVEGLNNYVNAMANETNWGHVKGNWVNPMVSGLEKAEKNEVLYAFVNNLMENYVDQKNEEMRLAMSVLRSKASQGIQGLIPVPKSDPTYDLYLANQYLAFGNEPRAWQLAQPKLKQLTKNWEKFDISFNAWVAEQMRKQKILDDALKFCLTILVKEYDLDAENVALVTLVKGDIYRDMNNNAAAKMEYQGLVANKRYSDTPAGRQAKYRLIELMIMTKEYSSAEMQLERLADIGTIEEQADANYYFAQIAFEQGDAEASAAALKKCFKLVHGHIKGRLLEGRLKLILPRGLQDPEVQVGRLDLQTIVIPGKSLKLKLQDNNLSIARGGKSIPVIVSTSSGDVEKVDLFAGSNDTTVFAGNIKTALGVPKKGNIQLEVNGNDEVSYIIDPEFQKANEINYPAKILAVKSDARLVASSGEILSEEEEEKRELQRRMNAQGDSQSMVNVGRNNKTIRPGSPIYVELTDFDRDISSEKDKIALNIKTASGDIMEGFEITETGNHTGIFQGSIPTGLPFPLVVTSDVDEGRDPNSIINRKKNESWKSLADGVKPKWIEVDTMNSYKFKEIDIACKQTDTIKGLSLYGVLADDKVLIAKYPTKKNGMTGGLTVNITSGGDHDPQRMRRLLQYKTEQSYQISRPIFDRKKDTNFKGGAWIMVSMTGAFYIPEAREVTMKITCSNPQHDWQGFQLSIDGKYVAGRTIMRKQDFNKPFKVFLKKGIHELEGLFRGHEPNAITAVEYEKQDGSFVPLSADWFSVFKNKELAEKLKTKGTITKTATGFKAVLNPPERYRKFRWVFDDFSTTAIEVDAISAVDENGKQVLPVDTDFTAGKANKTIEVAAGDEITITYKDDKRLDNDMPLKEAQLNSSFANAKINLAFEEISVDDNGKENISYSEAKRIRKGDQLMAIVTDYDEDLTDERDKVKVHVSTTSGEKLVMDLLETGFYDKHKHTGRFLQILKFGDKTGGNTIKINPDDTVTVSYLDKENTKPGIPFERKYILDIEERDNPELTVYKTDVKMVEDNSVNALAKIRNMRVKGDTRKDIKILKEQILVSAPDEKGEGKIQTVNVKAPLILEVNYPKMALHSRSKITLNLVADSELAAAKKEGREPTVFEVPAYIRNLSQHASNKGYPIQTSNVNLLQDEEMLDKGVFSGVVRLQIGSPGDKINNYIETESSSFLSGKQRKDLGGSTDKYTIPTILVAGSDVINISMKNDKGEDLVTKKIKLLSDGRLELLDRTYAAPMNSIHLGQTFFVRLTDPDQDVSDGKDEVKVKVTSTSGDKVDLVLKETIPHSGVFTGTLIPGFIKKDPAGKPLPPKTDDEILSVNFGDTVDFEFIDNLSISSKEPLKVTNKGHIHQGADGKLASFTKKFKDPDMAVKTRFLMAEAMFEVAKEYRNLKKNEEAAVEIAKGKRILEEAMRDYPNTTLKAQGEFLLANLSQELEKYEEAIGRYSNVISNWPTSEYAIRAQLKKAICLEKLKHFEQACEEYVKLTYLYPDSQYVADATIRMGNYYYKYKKYGVAARIFKRFQHKNSDHKLAPKSLFLAANCQMRLEKEKEAQAGKNAVGDYTDAIETLNQLLENYKDDKDLRSESMYWLADCYSKQREYKKAYRAFKNLTWDYPETKWAKIARGRLTEETMTRVEENENK